MDAVVLREVRDGVSTITLNRPERLNAINEALVDALDAALKAAQDDPATRAIVLRGAGRAFCAGDDLKEFDGQSRSPDVARRYLEKIQDVSRRILFGDKPVVAAARGWAAGGGLEWLIDADLVVMGRGTSCFFPEISLGVFVTGGVTALLPRLVGLQRARSLILFGDRFTAEEALAMGIAWRVVEDDRVDDEARAAAERIASLPAGAVRNLKRVLNRALDADLETVLRLETEAAVEGFVDPATAARVAASGPRRR